jgi:hypothetical protein
VKKLLRAIAVILFLATTGFWLAAGANLKWTKTSVEKRTLDEVTGIEGITYEKKFVPGIDFLVAANLTASGLLIGSFFPRNKTATPQPTPNHAN